MNIRKYMQIISWHYFDTSRLAAGLFIPIFFFAASLHQAGSVKYIFLECLTLALFPASQTGDTVKSPAGCYTRPKGVKIFNRKMQQQVSMIFM